MMNMLLAATVLALVSTSTAFLGKRLLYASVKRHFILFRQAFYSIMKIVHMGTGRKESGTQINNRDRKTMTQRIQQVQKTKW